MFGRLTVWIANSRPFITTAAAKASLFVRSRHLFFFFFIYKLFVSGSYPIGSRCLFPSSFLPVSLCVCVKCVCSVSNDLDNRYTRRQRKREASPRTRGSLLQGAEETKKKRNKFFGSFLFFFTSKMAANKIHWWIPTSSSWYTNIHTRQSFVFTVFTDWLGMHVKSLLLPLENIYYF